MEPGTLHLRIRYRTALQIKLKSTIGLSQLSGIAKSGTLHCL